MRTLKSGSETSEGCQNAIYAVWSDTARTKTRIYISASTRPNQKKSGLFQSSINSRSHDSGDGEAMFRYSRRSLRIAPKNMSESISQSSSLPFAPVSMRDVGKETANIDSIISSNIRDYAGRSRQQCLLNMEELTGVRVSG